METNTDWKKIADQRRIARHARDLTLRDVAPLIGISAAQLHRFERGKAMPRADVWERWGRVLETEEVSK